MKVVASCVGFLRLPTTTGVRTRWMLELACGHCVVRRRHVPPVVGVEYRCSRCEGAN